jgi:hypothetical protein
MNGASLTAVSEKGLRSTFTIRFANPSAFALSRFELSHKTEAPWTQATKR